MSKAKSKTAKTANNVADQRPLTPRELARFRRLLEAARWQLRRDVNSMQGTVRSKDPREACGNLSNLPMHMADVAGDSYELEVTVGLMENGQTLLREINEALERLDNGTYGVCLGTGKPIGRARLRARPWTKYCVQYAEELERLQGLGQ